jgi:fucose permease
MGGILQAPNVFRHLALFALLGVAQASLGPLIPVVAAAHHCSPTTAGLLVSAFSVGSLGSILACKAVGERRLGSPRWSSSGPDSARWQC